MAHFPSIAAPWTIRSTFARYFWVVVMLLVGNDSCADAQPIESLFTSIQTTTCKAPPPVIVAAYHARGLSVQECPAPEGWRLFTASSDERSWLEMARDHTLWSTEEEVVYRNTFGHFPNLGADRVEWRIKKTGMPTALIFRVAVQDPDRPAMEPGARSLSRMFVVGLISGVPHFCGTAKTNKEAQAMADEATTCATVLLEHALPQ